MPRVVHIPHRECPNCHANVPEAALACPSCRFPLTGFRGQDTQAAAVVAGMPVPPSTAYDEPATGLSAAIEITLRLVLSLAGAGVGLGIVYAFGHHQLFEGFHDFRASVGGNASLVMLLVLVFGALLSYPRYTLIARLRRIQQWWSGTGPAFILDVPALATGAVASLLYASAFLIVCRMAPVTRFVPPPDKPWMAHTYPNVMAFGAGSALVIGLLASSVVVSLGNTVIGWRRYVI